MLPEVEKQTLKIIYEVIMAVLSISIAVILVLDYSVKLPNYAVTDFNMLDNVILIVFAVDYFTRLFLAEDKRVFFRKNIIDLISIIPFGSIFQALRIAEILKLTELLRLTKVFRSVVLFMKFKARMDKFFRTNNFGYVLFITLFVLFLGTIGMHLSEGISIGNALWWSFVTISTVGYGDISPSTVYGRIIAGFLMLTGIGFLSMLTGTISTYFLSRNNNKGYKSEVINNIKEQLDNFDKLTKSDIDNICKVLKALGNNENT